MCPVIVLMTPIAHCPRWEQAVSVNQMVALGPAVIADGRLPASSPKVNSVIRPAGVNRPIALFCVSVNQMFPSAPAATAVTVMPAAGNRVNRPSVVRRATPRLP